MKSVKIKELFDIRKGKKAEEVDNSNLRYIQIEDLRDNENIKFCSISESNVLCIQDDILIAWDGANAGTVGFGVEGVIGSTIARLRPKTDGFVSDYVGLLLQSKFDFFQRTATGATIPHVSRKALENLEIPLPTLSEQEAIVAKLDRAQRLIDIDREMLAKYDELIQSVFLEMFGDPVRNDKGFDKGTIRDLVSEVRYGTSKKAHESEGEYPVIRMGNLLYNGDWDFTDLKYVDLGKKELPKYLVHKGDILFNRTNSKELVGKTGVYRREEPIAYAGYLIRVRPNERAINEYISGYLNSRHGKLVLEHMCKNIVGMANINAQELQDIRILIPPIELQNEYKNKIDEIRSQKSVIETEMKKSEELFSSLVQKFFN